MLRKINYARNYAGTIFAPLTGTIKDQTFAINEIGPTVTQDFTLAKLAILT